MESVERLNINTQNSDFRKNASNVIAAMLEARVTKQQPKSQKPLKNGNFKRIEDPEFLPPPPPLPLSKAPIMNAHDNDFLPPPPPPPPMSKHAMTLIDFNTCDQDLPLPPPPSPLKIPASILTPPLSSDENDLPQKTVNNTNNVEKVNYRNKKHHSNGHNNQSSDLHNAPSSFSINKPELSTHARDRRSYIEKNNNETFMNAAKAEAELDVAKIADELANGQHPVCDKCKCKITRYVRVSMVVAARCMKPSSDKNLTSA